MEVAAPLILRDALRNPRLLEYPPLTAIESLLRLLRPFSGVDEVSVWSTTAGGSVRCVAYQGQHRPTKRMRAVALSVIAGDVEVGQRSLIQGVPLFRAQRPWGALVVRSRSGGLERMLPLLNEAAEMLANVLERDHLLARNEEQGRLVAAVSERRLMRLGFDLHDGPLQDLVSLANDFRGLYGELERRPPDAGQSTEERDGLLARMDALDAGIREIDRQLRELAVSLQPMRVVGRPFQQVLSDEVVSFAERAHVEAAFIPRGDFEVLTVSQRIALLLVVKEALANVREHSGAHHTRVSITIQPDQIEGEIWDDGQGFDVERALARAAKSGRLGLVGMSERIRLLGGRLEIQSRRGGPTEANFTFPVWRPVEELEHASRRRTDRPPGF